MWDNSKIWFPSRNRTHGLSNIGWALYPQSYNGANFSLRWKRGTGFTQRRSSVAQRILLEDSQFILPEKWQPPLKGEEATKTHGEQGRRWGVSNRSDERLTLETSVFESLNGGQFILSTQLIKPNCLVTLHTYAETYPLYSIVNTLHINWIMANMANMANIQLLQRLFYLFSS